AICGKSPATGLWAESNIGGYWGYVLRKTGFDGIWITGKAESPVFIDIDDEEVKILDASHLWGLDTYTVQDKIKSELGRRGVRVAGIGVGGERLIPFSSILCDHGRVAGRTGLGAVMGSKNLKAMAVSGTGKIPIAMPKVYAMVRGEMNRGLRGDPLSRTFRELGTAGAGDYMDYLGSMPKMGYSRGYLEGMDNLSGSVLSEKYLDSISACHGCVIACGRVFKLSIDSKKQKGPEYETMVGFGPNLGITDPIFITKMGEICDLAGIDTISASNTISLAFRLFELNILSEKDVEGLELTWGNQDAVEVLLRKMIEREGIGYHLSKGARHFAGHFGVEELAVQVNGLEIAYHDPRALSGMALVYATSPRGGCHNQSDYYFVDVGGAEEVLGIKVFSRQAGPEKAANVVLHQNWRTVFNALIVCIFGSVSPRKLVTLINAACDLDWEIDDLMLAGDRAWNLKRVINNRLGLRRENDTLPKPFLEPLPDGGAAGYIIEFESMLKAYYRSRDWDWETGFPKEKKLEELGLKFVIADLNQLKQE
ncbi:MAG: aldehyde ferredoxin oxidoreductase family protein, partial [Anaerolineales bacterium]